MIETYIPLYRKYRPQAFADVVGQEAIVQTLGNAIALNKVAHAYLFCGPRGTGKTSTARIFAKSLNCEQGPTTTPCQTCASCTGITEGNALDVIEFDAASNNGVNDARELIENCQYSSMSGRFKVYIIDEVHMLTPQAFNALLKTLEEPPPNVIFIFATTEAHKVLPTIISRCQRFDFQRITTQDILARLSDIAQRESILIDEEATRLIARHARGGMRDAVGLLDQVSVLGRAQQGKVIERQDVSLFIGALEEELLLNLAAAIAERRAADLLSEIGKLVNQGIEPIQLLKDLTLHFRNLLMVSVAEQGTDPEVLSLPAEYYGKLVAQSTLFSREELPQIISRLAAVERNIRSTQQPQLWLEVGLVELAYRQDIYLVQELSQRINTLEEELARLKQGGLQAVAHAAHPVAATFSQPQAQPQAPPQAPVARPQPAPQATPPAVQTPSSPSLSAPAASGGGAGLESAYANLCRLVASPPMKALLQHTFPLAQDGDALTIGCSSEAILATLKRPEKLIHLQKAANSHYGREVRIDLTFGKKPEGSRTAAPPPMSSAPSAPAGPLTEPAPAIEAPPAASSQPAPPASDSLLAAMVAQGDDFDPSGNFMADSGPDFPPDEPDDDEPDEGEPADTPPPVLTAVAAVTETTAPVPAEPAPDGEWDEARKYTVELLQGRVVE